MPVDPVLHREARRYLRVLSGLMIITGALTLSAIPVVALYTPNLPPDMVTQVVIVSAVPFVVSTIAYINARWDYWLFGPTTQILVLLFAMDISFTYYLYLHGSTSMPTPGFYALIIVVGTVYFTRATGALALIVTVTSYALLLVIEEFTAIPHAPLYPAKSALGSLEGYALGTFGETAFLLGGAYLVASYIAGALQKRREEVEAANIRLQELDAAKTHFLGIVSHDLRTPVTSIKAFAEILEEEVPPEHKKYSRTIANEADRLYKLVTDLLDLDKMEAGKMEWNLVAQDIHPVLVNAVNVFQGASSDKGISLRFHYEEPLPHVKVDVDRLGQLMANLLSNAIKFTPPGGEVAVCVQAVTDHAEQLAVQIGVSDTGPGISPEDCDAIFERFAQSSAGRAHRGGTGLGLAIAKEIVDAHHGSITVESTVGKGTTFTVTLPVD